MIYWCSTLELFLLSKKKSKNNPTKNPFPTSLNRFFACLPTCYQEQTLMLKLWRYSQTTFLQCFCLFCLPFFGSDILWRGHHWVLFEESQTLSRFMHVYKTANTCNNANIDVNEVCKFFDWNMYLCNPHMHGIASFEH